MRVAFLNHPLGAVQSGQHPTGARDADWREMSNNVATAYEWMRFITRFANPKIVVMSPAIGWAGADIPGSDILKMMPFALWRSDFLIDVNWSSGHMGIMRNFAQNASLPSVDLTRWGQFPPWDDDAEIKQINTKLAEVRFVKKRAVWMPPLPDSDIKLLREVAEMLVDDPKNIERLQVLRTLINAAAKPL